jgi:hypothetical protein
MCGRFGFDQVRHTVDVAARGFGIRTRLVRAFHFFDFSYGLFILGRVHGVFSLIKNSLFPITFGCNAQLPSLVENVIDC